MYYVEMIHRVAVFVHLAVATVLSVIYIPFPEICDGIIHFLVKRVDYIIVNGESYCEHFHQRIQSSGEDACSVVEENEPGDGEDGHVSEVESRRDGELQPDGCKDD